MDNNWRAAQAQAQAQAQGQVQIPGQVMGGEGAVAQGVETGDWRTQLQADSRQRIVNKIIDTLKRHLPFCGLQELEKIAVRFEEKIYTAATSQSDYFGKISLKMLTLEKKSHNPSLQSNAAGSQSLQPQMLNQVPIHTLSLHQPDENWYMDTNVTSHMTANQGYTDEEAPNEM